MGPCLHGVYQTLVGDDLVVVKDPTAHLHNLGIGSREYWRKAGVEPRGCTGFLP